MKTNKLQAYWITIRSIWITFVISSVIVFKTILGKVNRQFVNRWCHKWARGLLDIVQLSYKFFDPYNLKLIPALAFNVGVHTEIHIGKPIDTKDYPAVKKNQLMEDLRRSIKEYA